MPVKRSAVLSVSAVFGVAAVAYGIGAGRAPSNPEGSIKPSEASTYDASRHYKERQARFEAESSHADLVMLGDSLTEVGQWSELLPGKVANRGISGDTSKGVLSRLGQVLELHPTVVCLLIGTNDLLLGREVDEISQTVSAVIYSLQAHGISVVLTSVPFVAESFPIRINGEVLRLNNILQRLAVSQRTAFVDLNALTAENGQLAREDTIEGLHLSNEAYKKWAAALRPVLEHLTDASRG
jgi:lysophospholipase L1-like esterase